MPVSKIEPEHVADLFRGEDGDFEDGLWVTNHMIAKRVLNQVLRVFKDAILRRKRPRPNPADDIKELLPKVVYKTKHRAAVPFKDLAAFIARLRAFDRIEARALEFVILTAARVNTVALMTWGEIDGSVWTAPAEHMKGSKDKRAEHRCPLSDRALEILRGLPRGKPGDLVFLPRLAHPRSRGKGHIKLGRSIHDFLRGPMGEKVVTIHGFRASFSQWCDDVDVSPAVSEQALAHVFGNRVSQAYKEGSEKRFKQRIPVMQAWADYCTGKVGGDNVVQFAAAK
jgi:integrase